MVPVGTLVNASAIALGSVVGLVLRGRFPERIRIVSFQGVGLCVLVIGMQMAFDMKNALMVIIAVLLGGILGELLRLEELFERLALCLKGMIRSKNPLFTDGFISASLIFCIGAMAIVGSFDEGIRGDHSVLFTKSVLDGFTSVVLATTYGVGVLFSAVSVLLYQGVLTLFATSCQSLFSPDIIAQLTATGGVLILGIGINILEIKQIRISSMLPSLFIIVLLSMWSV
ncbi:DUF554 domain-containing protein [Desulfoplanes formicivorans]|uniref:DUF554 domain-containing protein n=1 Tax=Desulfoplanes formicivorans TaxID=1592317 RepID=UPI00159EF674|nr:DUF554 domain-containing protein [Desulfoplanes formicivorans]